MIVHFLLLIRDVDGDEVGVFGIVHFDHLLLVRVLGLGPVVAGLGLFAPSLELLACSVVLALDLAQVFVGGVALGGEVIGIVGMAFSQLFESRAVVFERFSDLGNEVVGVGVVLGCSGFDGGELGRPSSDGCAGRMCE